MYKKSLFIFRRDLRLQDNSALISAIKNSKKTVLIFIFDPKQATTKNKFFSKNAVQFMFQALDELKKEVSKNGGKLNFLVGEPDKIVAKVVSHNNIEAVFCNRDYTPFSIKRDEKIKKACLKNKIKFMQLDDYLLTTPESVSTQSGTSYKIFTSFYKQASLQKVLLIQKTVFKGKISNASLSGAVFLRDMHKKIVGKGNSKIAVDGGRAEGQKIIRSLSGFKKYSQIKDFPSKQTTRLSAHLKFGTVSVREVFYSMLKKLGPANPLIRQLYWRDFFTHVAYHSPFVFGQPFYKKYKKIKWINNRKKFNLWCEGKTGFPIVDAGMRELNETGYMHNRVRMITASFLVKDLHIDWQWGEKYFATKLVDYDPAVNNGNWQWVASTGCDSQPYFRIFNPWLQQKKLDPKCEYIKKWLPELEGIDPKVIHAWNKHYSDYEGYPSPILEHSVEAEIAKGMWRV